jgi:hypothetical protein
MAMDWAIVSPFQWRTGTCRVIHLFPLYFLVLDFDFIRVFIRVLVIETHYLHFLNYTPTCPKGVVGFTACQATGSTKGATMRESCSYNVAVYNSESRL